MTRIAAASVALLLLVAPAAAHAKGNRAAAKDFARAAEQLRAAAVAQRQVVETGANRLTRDPACKDAFGHVPTGPAYEAAVALVFPYSFEAQIGPVLPALEDYVAALGRVKVRDKRLRGGRAALRRTVRAARGLQPAPADICTRLQAWQQAGYPTDGAPTIDDPAFDRLLALPRSLGKKTHKAEERLRALGISKRTALLFTAADEALFKGFDLDSEVPIGDQT